MADRGTIPTANLGVFDHAQLQETDSGRLRQQPTARNGNIYVLGANLATFGTRSLTQSFG